MKTTRKFLIVLVAALGMATGCASNSPPPDEDPRQMEGAEPMEPMQEAEPTQEAEPMQEAEPSGERQPVEPKATSSASIQEDEIDAFVDTHTEVTRVRQAYQERISQAPTSDEARALQQEAATALRSVIDRGELDPERYVQIAKLAETDPNVARMIRERMAADGPDDS